MTSFVLTYNRTLGTLGTLKEFPSREKAIRERVKLEREKNDEKIEVVSISAVSLEALKKSHSRYFIQNQVA
ncbi:hypothetical protein [Rothia amarae]|uniref:hypothetical protein n=1 Tax=Rothia amarae TaxID=169480 RepID=UPI0031E17735